MGMCLYSLILEGTGSEVCNIGFLSPIVAQQNDQDMNAMTIT